MHLHSARKDNIKENNFKQNKIVQAFYVIVKKQIKLAHVYINQEEAN
jgi:predicted aspartyl protease